MPCSSSLSTKAECRLNSTIMFTLQQRYSKLENHHMKLRFTIGKQFARLLAVIAIFVGGHDVSGQGFITPFEESDYHAILKKQEVRIEVHDRVAEVVVKETYHNPYDVDIQGYYNYSFRKDCQPRELRFTIKGADFKGNFLEEEKAKDIYLDAFRGRADHGFLRMMGQPLFRARIYPIFAHASEEIVFRYKEQLPNDDGLVRIVCPFLSDASKSLASTSAATKTDGDYFASLQHYVSTPPGSDSNHEYNPERRIEVTLTTNQPIRNVYSPTHDVHVTRSGEQRVRVVYKERAVENEGDFILYYGEDNSDIGVDILTHKRGDEDGYHMILLTPSSEISQHKVLKKDLIIVTDISSSMRGQKLRQVKEALTRGLETLNPDDHFNIIAFNNEVKMFSKSLVKASERRSDAMAFVRQLEAGGGTNLNEALLTAVNLQGSISGIRTLVLITDGKPTVGLTDVAQIRDNLGMLNHQGFKLISFAIGAEVNARLLDGLAHDSNGAVRYLENPDRIEPNLSAFFDEISKPVFRNISLRFSDSEAYDVYPEKVDALFMGKQVSILGRHRGKAPDKLILSGQADDGVAFEHTFRVTPVADGNDFLPVLWHARRAGHNIDELRFNTPTENVDLSTLYLRYREIFPQLSEGEFSKWFVGCDDDGIDANLAIQVSKQVARIKQGSLLKPGLMNATQRVGGKIFRQNKEGYWTELSLATKPTGDVLNIRYRSNAYFSLLQNYAETAAYLALGPKLVFNFYQTFIKIDEQGVENISKTQLDELLMN